MVEESGVGPGHPFSGEKLCPVLTVYRARDFDHAMQIVERIYAFIGAGHSVGLHTTRNERALALGHRLPVSRVIVNQVHCVATGGSFDNGLPFSLSMGCGTWGRNNFSDNMNYRHYLNITRVSTHDPRARAVGRRDLRRLFRSLWPRLSCADAHGPPADRRARGRRSERDLLHRAAYRPLADVHGAARLVHRRQCDACRRVARRPGIMCRWCLATAFRQFACCWARCTAAIACTRSTCCRSRRRCSTLSNMRMRGSFSLRLIGCERCA